jgi:hypothetical protein
MNWILGIVLTAITLITFNDIAKINRLKSEAHESYLAGVYQQAIEKYAILVDSFQVTEQEVLINYANAAFLATRKSQSPTAGIEGPGNSGPEPTSEQAASYQKIAQQTYTNIAQTATANLQSKAFNQLGVMAFHTAPPPKPGKEVLLQAQNLFKSALITDQTNQQARFNYELVTKMLNQDDQQDQQDQQEKQDQEQQEQDQQDQQQQEDQQQQDQQDQQQQSGDEEQEQQEQQGQEENQEQQQGEPEESESQQPEEQQGEEKPQEQLNASPEKMEELKISEEKARMILEAMKNSEVQYIQQNQKKATKRPDSGKPDW